MYISTVQKYNTKLSEFLQKRGLQLNDSHLKILIEQEIDGLAFLVLNEKMLKDYGFKV